MKNVKEFTEHGFTARPLQEILNDPDVGIEPDWIVPGLVARGEVTLIYGKPKVGKSTLSAAIAVRVQEGDRFLDSDIESGNVLWLNLERPEAKAAAALRDVGGTEGILIHTSYGRFGYETKVLREFVEREGIDLIVLDSLRKFWNPDTDSNSSESVNEEMIDIYRLARDLRVGLMIIHHSRKAEGSIIDGVLGSVGLAADADTILRLTRSDRDPYIRVLEGRGIHELEGTPDKLFLRFDIDAGVYLGARDREAAQRAAIVDLMPMHGADDGTSMTDLVARSPYGESKTAELAKLAVEKGEARRERDGKQYLYWRMPF